MAYVATPGDSQTGAVACCVGSSLSCIQGTSKAGNIEVSLHFPPPSSPLPQSPDNQDGGQRNNICIQQQQRQTFSRFADTESMTKTSSELKKNPHERCIDASRKMKSIFHLACIQLLKEHNTTLMCCQECGSSSAEILG